MKAIIRGFARNGAIIASGQLVSLLLILLLSRAYGPKQFSEYALVLSAFTILSTIVTLKLSDAIFITKSRRNVNSLIQLNIFTSIILCAVSYLIFSLQERIEWLSKYSAIIVLSGFVFSVGTCFYNLLVRKGQLLAFSFFSAALPISTAVFQLGFARFSADENGLENGFLAGNAFWAFALFFTVAIGEGLQALKIYPSWRFYWSRLKASRNYPLYSVPYNLTASLRLRGILLILGQSVVTGQYQILDRVLVAPSSLMGSVLRPIMIRHVHEKGLKNVQQDVWFLCRSLVLLCSPFFVWSWLHPEMLIGSVFGKQWIDASILWFPLSANAITMMLTNWMDRFFDFLEEQRKRTILEMVYSFFSLMAAYAALRIWPNEPSFAVYAYAVVSCLYGMHWLAFLGSNLGDQYLVFKLLGLMCAFSGAGWAIFTAVELFGSPLASFSIAILLTLIVALILLKEGQRAAFEYPQRREREQI